MKKMTTLRFIACWLCLCPLFCMAQDRYNDSLALVALHDATNGIDWINKWNLAQPMDTWYGVSLNNGRVTCIDMDGEADCVDDYIPGNKLVGNIPPEIGDLDELYFLSFANNELSGNIPPEIEDLDNLVIFMLYGNQLNGNIPSTIGNLNSLQILNWVDNQLSGNIPSEIGNLDNLTYLRLDDNQLSGNIPPEIGNLNNLGTLNLSSNQLTGSIPPEIGDLTNLINLRLEHNQLSGCYDDNLASLCNQLSSNIFISNGNEFVASWEDFCNTGEGCISCRQSDSLALVALYESTDGANWITTWDLSLPMDTWYGVSLDLNGCVICIDMDGGDRDCMGDYSDGGNNLLGNIPPEIGNLSRLEKLNLINNQLNDSIPSEIGNLHKLIALLLPGNQLSGSIPPEIENLDTLQSLDLGYNQLRGNIPPEIGDLDRLETLNLWGNELEGSIPSEIGNLDSLWFLKLFDNRLSGNIPSEIGDLTNLRLLYLYNNQLTGNIPSFDSLNYLTDLRLEKNKFSFDAIQATYNSNNSLDNFQYSPQYHGEVQSHIITLDTTLTLELFPPLPGNNNQDINYQWKRNYNDLAESTDATYTIDSLQLSNVGEYTLHMTDPNRVSELEVISEPIYVVLPGYDLYGDSVVYNQIIVEFDNEADKMKYEQKYVYPIERPDLAAKLKDSCDCNRLLYLWEFPNDSIAFQAFLDINTKKESTPIESEVDGGFNNTLGIGPISGTQGWTWTDDYLHSYDDTVSIFLLDSGTDTLNWDATPYLYNHAPIDSCYDTISCAGYDYADTLTTIKCGFVDSIGHGTFGMRSISEGSDAYMNMNVVPLKVFDKNGRGTLFNFICALYHAIDHDADIINISAGYSGQPSDILENAIALAHSKGQFIVTATGNEGVNIDSFPQYPAYYAKQFYKTAYDGSDSLVHYDNVISVAAIDAMDSLWQYSNYGNEAATISAYGENMGGYSHTGEEVSYSGTSISTYYVTRQLAAEIARDKTRSLEEIWTDFETDYLRDCPATDGLTSTGKRLDISLREVYSDLRVFLEGAFDISGDTMRTDLNTLRRILPGQIDSTFDHATATQPYDTVPFDYYGMESVPSAFNDYPSEVVDWILVSVRTEPDADSTLNRTAAWLLKDGRVQLLQPLFDELDTAPDSVYIVIEHRNHMGVMSPQKLPVERNIVVWDFTAQDSYTTSTGTGQTILDNLNWGMLAGDTNNDIDGYDINGADKGFWQNNNGNSRLYLPTDFNLNGDINGEDKIFWERNNGKSSNVPRY